MRSGLSDRLVSIGALSALAAILAACSAAPAPRDPRAVLVDELESRFESFPSFRTEILLESKTVGSQPTEKGSFTIHYDRARGVARAQGRGTEGPPDLWELVADDGTSLILWSPGSFAVRTRPPAFLEAFLPANHALDEVAPDPRRRHPRGASRPAPQLAVGLAPTGDQGAGFRWGLALVSDGGPASWLDELRSSDVRLMDVTDQEVKFWRSDDRISVAVDRRTGFPSSMSTTLSDGSSRPIRTVAFEIGTPLDVPPMPAPIPFDLPADYLDSQFASTTAGLGARIGAACDAWSTLREEEKVDALRDALALWFAAYAQARRELWLGALASEYVAARIAAGSGLDELRRDAAARASEFEVWARVPLGFRERVTTAQLAATQAKLIAVVDERARDAETRGEITRVIQEASRAAGERPLKRLDPSTRQRVFDAALARAAEPPLPEPFLSASRR